MNLTRKRPDGKKSLTRTNISFARARLPWGRMWRIVSAARHSVVDRMIDGLVVLDSRNQVLDINSSAHTIFGNSCSYALGQSAAEVFSLYPDVVENLRFQSLRNQEVHIQRADGTFYYLLNINPLMDSSGRTVGKMLLFQDITSLKLTELKLVEAKARAEQADNLKTAFLANMSHEIRTPMNAIIGFSNLLNDTGVSEEERNEFIGHIKNSGNSLLQLIDDIIDISRLDAGQITVDNSPLSITRLMAELFSWFNESLRDEGKEDIQLLVSGISDSVDIWVMTDGSKINRIMRHLLANAVKFTHSGFIEFGIRLDGPGKLNLFVQDTGIGIAREKQGMIFERFSRVMAGTSQDYGGTGMGLAICKGLTELMGGQIRVESSLGAGSTFFVDIPVTQVEQKPVPDSLKRAVSYMTPASLVMQEPPVEPGLIGTAFPSVTPVPFNNWAPRLILVVEPEEIGYLNIEMILRPSRVKLLWAKNMREALNCLGHMNPVDAAILSVNLNENELEETIASMVNLQPGLPVVVLMPLTGPVNGKDIAGLGCAALLAKPVTPASLLGALDSCLS